MTAAKKAPAAKKENRARLSRGRNQCGRLNEVNPCGTSIVETTVASKPEPVNPVSQKKNFPPALDEALKLGRAYEAKLNQFRMLSCKTARWRRIQFIAAALQMDSKKIAPSVRSVVDGLFRAFTIGDDGRRRGPLAKYFDDVEWMSAPTHIVEKAWNVTRHQRIHAL